jgi:hypothetical protein
MGLLDPKEMTPDPLAIQLGLLAALRARLQRSDKPWSADVVDIVDEVEREIRAAGQTQGS